MRIFIFHLRYILLFYVILVFNSCPFCYPQTSKVVNNWYFGANAGVSFNTGSPVAFTTSAMNTYEGCSSISDTNGILLFYTNGVNVWNKNNAIMTNGSGLNGCSHSCQAALIVKKPGSNSLYYIFTTWGSQCGSIFNMYYSIVDITASGGLGAVTTKNTFVLLDASERLSACNHQNNTDIWVVTQIRNSNTFYAYLLTASGLSSPVVTSTGSNLAGYYCSKLSHNGQKIAASNLPTSQVELLDFNNLLGTVSNPILLPVIAPEQPYGIEFSPDDTKLYTLTMNTNFFGLYQYDLCNSNQRTILATGSLYGGSLQLGPDGKIYTDLGSTNYLGVINNPNLAGTACNFVQNAVSLSGKSNNFGLPNFVQSYFVSGSSIIGNAGASSNSPVCEGKTLTFNANSYTGATYHWTGPNGFSSLLRSPSITSVSPNSQGQYHLTVNLGCTGALQDTISIIINSTPRPGFLVNNANQCLSGNNFIFTNRTIIFTGTFHSLWKFGDNDTSNQHDPSHSYKNPGTYTVRLVTWSDSGCFDSASMQVKVNPMPVAGFTISKDSQCFKNNFYIFSNTSTLSLGSFTSLWNLGDSTISGSNNIVTHKYTYPDTFKIKLIVTSDKGCQDSIVKPVFVLVSPVSNFNINDSDQCFRGNSFSFNNNSSVSKGSFTNFWNFGDSNTSIISSPIHSYIKPGNYPVKLIITSNSGCKDSISKTVYVRANPVTSFSINDSSQCFKNNSFVFTNKTVIASGTYTNLWKFGDNISSPNFSPVHSYLNPGIYTVKLFTNSNFGCKDSMSKIVNVMVSPAVNFTINDSVQCFDSNSFIFKNNSVPSDSIFQNKWNFGDNDSSNLKNPVHIFKTSGIFIIKLITILNNKCSDSAFKKVTINPMPGVPKCRSNAPVCEGGTLILISDTFTGSNYQWTGPNGFISNKQNPVIPTAALKDTGIYTVIRIVSGCKSQPGMINIHIKPLPNIPNIYSNSPVCEKDSLKLSTDFLPGASYSWSAGNGFQSIIKNPVIYPTALSDSGIYYLIMTLNGCQSKPGSAKIVIKPKPFAPVIGSNSPLCTGQNLNLTSNNVSDANFFWSSVNGFNSNKQNPVINNISLNDSGIYVLFIDVKGCKSNTASTRVIINLVPDTPIVTGNLILCEGEKLIFQTNDIPGGIFDWTGPYGYKSSVQSPVINSIRKSQAGIYLVTVSLNNCISIPSHIPVIVYPLPVFSFGPNVIVCGNFNLTLKPGNFSSYLWQDSSYNSEFSVTQPGTYFVTVSNPLGCEYSDTLIVTEICPPSIFIPNSFSPNGDGINDSFTIKGYSINEYEIKIFDRWGEQIFQSNNMSDSWNGTYKSQICAEGVYYWMIVYSGKLQNYKHRKMLHGTITLIR